jgi:homoserine kinase
LIRSPLPLLLLLPGAIRSFFEVKQQITVRVPASTSNLGPGFDSLGVALRLYNAITVRRGENATLTSMMRAAANKFFAAANHHGFKFSCEINGAIPVSRGLGSSAAIRLGLMHALNELLGSNFSRSDLFALGAALEGHPDNAAPASFGGFNVVRGLETLRFEVSSELHFVLLVPDFELQTKKSRRLLPPEIPRTDAVMSAGNAAFIVAAFASGDYEKLRGAFRDGLHQPYRKNLIPFLDDVIASAENAGALGAFLSGSGSAICAVTLRDPEKVGRAMQRSACGRTTRVMMTNADNRGVRVLKSSTRSRQSRVT